MLFITVTLFIIMDYLIKYNGLFSSLALSNKNDILLVLGKGHETYQIIGDNKFDMDDKQIVLDNL